MPCISEGAPNNSMPVTALRAADDAGRYPHRPMIKTYPLNVIRLSLFILIPALFVSLVSVPSVLHAQERVPLSLRKAVERALQAHVDIEMEQKNLQIREASILLEEAVFDPSIYFDIRTDQSIRGSTSLIEAGVITSNGQIDQENQQINTGLKRRFGWGGSYDLTLGQVRSSSTLQSVNPTLRANAVITFTQPLLKGFGREIVQGPIRMAQNQRVITQTGILAIILEVIQEVSYAYWDLVFVLESRAIQQQAMKAARQLVDINKAKVSMGILAPVEVLVAESSAASRQEAVVIAEKGVKDAEDNLNRLLNLTEGTVQPTDRPMETKRVMDEAALLERALLKRPEMAQNYLETQNREVAFRMAKNQGDPSVDLVGNVGSNGLGKSPHDETKRLFSGDFYQWEIGVVFNYSLGNRTAEASLKKGKAELAKTHLARKKIVQQITQETREGIRRVATDFQRIETTRESRLLSEKKLAAGAERFQLGLISSHDLLEFQDDLANARGKELKAMVDYNKSWVHLEKVTGGLLESYQVEEVGQAIR